MNSKVMRSLATQLLNHDRPVRAELRAKDCGIVIASSMS